MKHQFDKKTYTPGVFFGDIFFLITHLPGMIRASRNNQISKAFTEKIMTVSTAVNGCVLCEWFHAKQAVSCGISDDEIKNMMDLQFHADASEFEIPALLYTQHFAETSQNPDPEMTQKFYDFYGKKNAGDIYLFIRAIYFGNLTGNTWEAVKYRFRGKPVPNSTLWFDLVFFLLTFLFMIPATWKMRRDKNNTNNKDTN